MGKRGQRSRENSEENSSSFQSTYDEQYGYLVSIKLHVKELFATALTFGFQNLLSLDAWYSVSPVVLSIEQSATDGSSIPDDRTSLSDAVVHSYLQALQSTFSFNNQVSLHERGLFMWSDQRFLLLCNVCIGVIIALAHRRILGFLRRMVNSFFTGGHAIVEISKSQGQKTVDEIFRNENHINLPRKRRSSWRSLGIDRLFSVKNLKKSILGQFQKLGDPLTFPTPSVQSITSERLVDITNDESSRSTEPVLSADGMGLVDGEIHNHQDRVVCVNFDESDNLLEEIDDLRALLEAEKRKSDLVRKLRECHTSAVTEMKCQIRKLEAEKSDFRMQLYNKTTELFKTKTEAENLRQELIETIEELREECAASEYIMNANVKNRETEIETIRAELGAKSATELDEKIAKEIANMVAEKESEILQIKASFEEKLKEAITKEKLASDKVRKLEISLANSNGVFNQRISRLESEKIGLQRATTALKKYMAMTKNENDGELLNIETLCLGDQDVLQNKNNLITQLQIELDELADAKRQKEERIKELESELESKNLPKKHDIENDKSCEESETSWQQRYESLHTELETKIRQYEIEKEELKMSVEAQSKALAADYKSKIALMKSSASEELACIKGAHEDAKVEVSELQQYIKNLQLANESLRLEKRSALCTVPEDSECEFDPDIYDE